MLVFRRFYISINATALHTATYDASGMDWRSSWRLQSAFPLFKEIHCP
jgi:hypothetical protein